MPYHVQLSKTSKAFIQENISKERILEKIEDVVELLSEYPGAGPVYAPTYIAAQPPFSCRHFPIPDTPFTLYYLLDDESKLVTIFSIEWSAGDPKKRFARFLKADE